jgi:hypothetical protein
VSAYLGFFEQEELTFCMEWTLLPVDGDDGSGLADAFADAVLKRVPRKVARLNGPCISSAPNKAILATCTFDAHPNSLGTDTTNPIGRRVKDAIQTTKYYDPRSLAADNFMHKCLQHGGDWRVLSSTSASPSPAPLRPAAQALSASYAAFSEQEQLQLCEDLEMTPVDDATKEAILLAVQNFLSSRGSSVIRFNGPCSVLGKAVLATCTEEVADPSSPEFSARATLNVYDRELASDEIMQVCKQRHGDWRIRR